MDIKLIIEAMKQGRVFLVGECRGAKVEVVRYVDKKTGQAAAFTSMTFLVERPGLMDVALISQQVGDGAVDPATVVIPVEKGKAYAFELSGMERIRGVLKARMPSGVVPQLM